MARGGAVVGTVAALEGAARVARFVRETDKWLRGDGYVSCMASALGVDAGWLHGFLLDCGLADTGLHPAEGATAERVFAVVSLYTVYRLAGARR